MATETFANQPSTTVSSGGTTAPAGGTVETWTVASSGSFPAASSTAKPATQFHVIDTAPGATGEIIAVTDVSGTTWTVTRGAESSAPVAHAAGFTITQVVTAAALGAFDQRGQGSVTPTAVKTTTYTAAAGDFVPCDTTSGSFTVTLPTAPADLTVIAVKQVIRGGTNTVTIATGGSDVFNVASGATSAALTLTAQAMIVQYKSSSAIWYVLADDLALAQLDSRYAQVANNLSDVTAATARTNLGLTAAATAALPLAIANGGSGQASKAAAFDALQPMSALGDVVYGGASGTGTRLAGDTSNTKKYLTGTASGGVAQAPAWAAIAAGDVPTLNQNTSGTAAALSATLAIGSGGTGQTTVAFAEYGDGSDGAATFDGTATPAGVSKSGSAYTATRDLYYTNATFTNSATLAMAGFRLFGTGTLTVGSGSVVSNSGNNASGTTGGAVPSSGSVGGGGSGGSGVLGGNGSGGGSGGSCGLGGNGGDGGLATGGGTGGGVGGGAVTAPTAAQGLPRNLSQVMILNAEGSSQRYVAGAGGSAGNAAASSTGGGGGGGGGILAVYFRYVINNGAIRSSGGNGGNASGAGTGAGGGGGGGGGVVIVLSATYTGTAPATAGGAGGSLQGAGAAGATGSTGNVYSITHGF